MRYYDDKEEDLNYVKNSKQSIGVDFYCDIRFIFCTACGSLLLSAAYNLRVYERKRRDGYGESARNYDYRLRHCRCDDACRRTAVCTFAKGTQIACVYQKERGAYPRNIVVRGAFGCLPCGSRHLFLDRVLCSVCVYLLGHCLRVTKNVIEEATAIKAENDFTI